MLYPIHWNGTCWDKTVVTLKTQRLLGLLCSFCLAAVTVKCEHLLPVTSHLTSSLCHSQVVSRSCWSLIFCGFQMPHQLFQLLWERFTSVRTVSLWGSFWRQQLAATFPSLLCLISFFYLSPHGQDKQKIRGGNSPRMRVPQQRIIQFILKLLVFGTKV